MITLPRKSNRLQITNQRWLSSMKVTEKCQTWSTELNYATPSQHVTYLLTILRTLEFQWVSRDSKSTDPLLFLTFLPKLLWFCVTVNGVTMCHLTRSSRFRLLEASPGQSQHDLRMWDSPNSIKCHKPTIWGWFIHVYIYVRIYIYVYMCIYIYIYYAF